MNKPLLVAILSVAVVLPAVSAPRRAQITVIDQPIGASALVRGDEVYLPLRQTFAALNSHVTYNPNEAVVEARNILHVLRIDLRSGSAWLDGRHLSSKVLVEHGVAYVPMSLAAQAMGAIVRYDPRSNTVAVNGSYHGKERFDPAHPPRELNPPPDSTVQTGYPVISASLGEAFAASNAVRLSVDGFDVTPQAHFDGRTITYVPQASLNPGRHTVSFDGNVSSGQPFATRWTFASNAPPANWYDGYGYGGGYGYGFYADQWQPYAGGSWYNLTMVGPPSGSGFVQICGPNNIYPLWNGGSRWYRARIALPSTYFAGNCGINATFIGPDGRRIPIPVTTNGNGLFITGNPINPLGQYPSAPLFVPLLPVRFPHRPVHPLHKPQ